MNVKSGIGAMLTAMLLVSMAFIPAVSAEHMNDKSLEVMDIEENLNKSDHVLVAKASKTITPETPGLSEKEFEVYVDKMKQKYGDAGVFGIEPEVGLKNSLPYDKENIQYVNSWTEHLEVKNSNGVVMASSDNLVALYKLDKTDELGREHYYYWQWSSAQNRENTEPLGDDSNLRDFCNKVNIGNSNYDLIVYSPDADIIGDEEVVTVNLGAVYQGVNCGISGDFVLHQDKVRPKPGECQIGNAGKYTVEWVGNYEGSQSINGACEERRPYGSPYDFVWDNSLTASQF
ncbi:MAG: hypothetical protein AWU58_2142 [Methanohalophilus sp. T328-1]|jgi:hypothetical protein|nr:MAG: hypothetical protein AWU58_2142 [Methanohalophilus sp. T328-1]